VLHADTTIISCAVTGSIHTPSMSPSLPVTPDAIAEQAVAAVKAGAAIIHLHARDPRTGRPSPDPAHFRVPVEALREHTDAILNISTGGSADMTVEERLAPARHWAPELASLNMGSMNFVFTAAARRVEHWLHAWEQPYVRGSADRIFANTFTQIEQTVTELGALGTRFEFECYDVGHLYTLAHFADREIVRPPFWIQTIYGILGGIGADQENLTHMVRIADRLFGNDYVMSSFAAGRHQMDFMTAAALHGGHVRVGLEDNLMIARGALATDNAQQVSKAATILSELGRTIATPAQARDILALRPARPGDRAQVAGAGTGPRSS
jgi:uncharacterized protein (DUF849 family)